MFIKQITPKNCYANPFNFWVCPITSIAVWLSLNRGTFGCSHFLFVIASKVGVTAHLYSKAFKNMLANKHQEVLAFGVDPI